MVRPSKWAWRAPRSNAGWCWPPKPGATLGIGTEGALNSDELRAASHNGEIKALMDWKPIACGDFYYIPGGIVHAIGVGVSLIEVQQNADVTYRLYDYGRPRELHLDDGVAVSRAAPYSQPLHRKVDFQADESWSMGRILQCC